MSKRRKILPAEPPHQPCGLTRRDLLRQAGTAGLSFTTVSPWLLALMQHESAMAGNGPIIPCRGMHIHAPGGAGVSGFFAPRDPGLNRLSNDFNLDYAVPSNQADLITDWGAPMWGRAPGTDGTQDAHYVSQFARAFDKAARLSAKSLGRVFIVVYPTLSGNDNTAGYGGGWAPAAAYTMMKLGTELKVAHVAGLANSPSTTGTGSVIDYPGMARVTARQLTDLVSVGAFCRSLANAGATTSDFNRLAPHLNKLMTASLDAKVGTGTAARAFRTTQLSATADLMARVAPNSELDVNALNPSSTQTSQIIKTILNVGNANTFGNTTEDLQRTLIYHAVLGIYGFTGFSMNRGFDYHGNRVADTEAADRALGDTVGRAAALFAERDQCGIINVTTDGSVSSTNVPRPEAGEADKVVWRGDDSGYGLTFSVIILPPSGWTVPKTQVGGWDPITGRIVTSSAVGTAPLAAMGVLATWMTLNGWSLSNLDTIGQQANMAEGAIEAIKTQAICVART